MGASQYDGIRREGGGEPRCKDVAQGVWCNGLTLHFLFGKLHQFSRAEQFDVVLASKLADELMGVGAFDGGSGGEQANNAIAGALRSRFDGGDDSNDRDGKTGSQCGQCDGAGGIAGDDDHVERVLTGNGADDGKYAFNNKGFRLFAVGEAGVIEGVDIV